MVADIETVTQRIGGVAGIPPAIDIEIVMQHAKSYADDVRCALPVDKVVLYGSYAKGTATALSDVDICFFLNNYGGKERFDIRFELLRMIRSQSGRSGIYFEPTVFPTSEIYNDNPFVKEILRTGIEI